MNYAPHYVVRKYGFHPALGEVQSPFDTTSGTASWAVGEAGALTAASLALVGLGPIGAIVGIGTQLVAMVVNQFKGCGQTCTLTSQAADQIENGLKQLLNAYLNSGHTKSEQLAALQAFDGMWAKLVQYCGNPGFQTAGRNCVQDRQAGACKWHSSPFGWKLQNGAYAYVPSGPDGSGSDCWNWFLGYRDAIAQDPTVRPDTPAISAAAAQLGLGSLNLGPLIIIGGLLALAMVI